MNVTAGVVAAKHVVDDTAINIKGDVGGVRCSSDVSHVGTAKHGSDTFKGSADIVWICAMVRSERTGAANVDGSGFAVGLIATAIDLGNFHVADA